MGRHDRVHVDEKCDDKDRIHHQTCGRDEFVFRLLHQEAMKAHRPWACPRKIPARGRGMAASTACALRCLILALCGALMCPGPLRGVEVGRILVKNGTLFTLEADETRPQR